MTNMGNILLTGATGFLGAHILDEYLKKCTGKAYCLVRGSDAKDAEKKLENTLEFYFGGNYADNKRIVAVHGDIKEFINVNAPIHTIIHCAAIVKHYGMYKLFYEENVLGTENIVRFAQEKGARLIYISTIGVSGNTLEQSTDFQATIFDETKLFIGQTLENVYVRSKFEAEKVVLQARLDGLNAIVIRVGNQVNRCSDLKFQRNYWENATLTRLKAFVDLQMYPEMMHDFPIEFSPVDFTAKAIIAIAEHISDKYSVFHAYNNRVIYFVDFIHMLRKAGFEIRSVTTDRFLEAMRSVEQAHEAFVNDITDNGTLRLQDKITLSSAFTQWFLNTLGFDWPVISADYLKRYIAYYQEIQYFGGINDAK
jgi:thioester reductase-like protein